MPSGYLSDQKDYDESWANRLNKIVSYIEAGERNIAEIFGKYRNYWMSGRWKVGELAEFVSAGETIQALARSGYVFYRNAVADAVLNECRKDTKAVVELGSGLGESTFTIWLEGRLRAPTFHVCEISPSGRKVSRILASLDRRMKLKAHFFDYRRPSFEGIPAVDGHVTVFSTHSIEQVSEVPQELIERICDLGTQVTALHFEPIGWQFAANRVRAGCRAQAPLHRDGIQQKLLEPAQAIRGTGEDRDPGCGALFLRLRLQSVLQTDMAQEVVRGPNRHSR